MFDEYRRLLLFKRFAQYAANQLFCGNETNFTPNVKYESDVFDSGTTMQFSVHTKINSEFCDKVAILKFIDSFVQIRYNPVKLGVIPMTAHYITHPMLERHAHKIFSEAQILFRCKRFYSRRSHYNVLNLKNDCSNDEIRQSFANLSKKYHPDTSKGGNAEQNSRKFQEIMEAYKVLSKKSTRMAYDAEISTTPQYPNYTYHHPYYVTQNRRERRFYEGDFASWQEHMRNNRQNEYYYRNRPNYEWSPVHLFSRKGAMGLVLTFVIMNFLSVFIVYSLSSRNRMYNEIIGDNQGIHYTRHGHGYTSRQYPIDIPDELLQARPKPADNQPATQSDF